ncbi:MAG: cytochrome P450 [Benjaminiella poitrasii]|nr:MAG: cytochrome P450 [Benjaminiella poitrasii]
MGRKTWIMVSDPILAHKIFVSRGAETSYRPHSIFSYEYYSLRGKGLAFSQPDGNFKKSRAAALSVLSPKHVEKYMEFIQQESDYLASQLMKVTEKEGSVNPFKLLELYSLNVMLKAGFGKRFDDASDPEFIHLADTVEMAMKLAGVENDLPNFLPILSIIDYFAGTQVKMKRFIKTKRDPTYRLLIKEAMLAGGDNIVKSLDADGYAMTEEEKIVFMSDMLSAATDTTAVTLMWIFAILCNYPKVQKKVFNEIDQFIDANGHIPTFHERKNFPYCISVIKECMRYKPTTSFGLPHVTHEELLIDNYVIPKGCTILSSMESMHKNPERYDNPETFYPERFMDNIKTMQAAANGKLEDRDHFNFGWGRRICPGIYLAEVEIFFGFIQVFSKCFIEPIDELQMPDLTGAENAGLAIPPLPYKVKFTRR